ncbi:TPA: hypothetical protein R4Y92_001396 [Klebsiella aerogenes]|nr:hypothetical protein [Klebsiella aerogenes]
MVMNPAELLRILDAAQPFEHLDKALSAVENGGAGWDAAIDMEAKLEAAEGRVLELESRVVKLPEIERPIDGTGYANYAGAQYYKEHVIKALTAQGIKWEAE